MFEDLVTKQKESFYLTKTTFLNHIPEAKLRQQLTILYNAEDMKFRLLATILNAIYTQGLTTFFLSQKSLLKLIEQDKSNLEYKQRGPFSLGRGNMKITYIRRDLMKLAKSEGYFDVIYEAQPQVMLPSMIDVIDEDIFNMMNEHGKMTKGLKANWRAAAINVMTTLIDSQRAEANAPKQDKQADEEVMPIVAEDNDTFPKPASVTPEHCRQIDDEMMAIVTGANW